jgi:hypothetical protein
MYVFPRPQPAIDVHTTAATEVTAHAPCRHPSHRETRPGICLDACKFFAPHATID